MEGPDLGETSKTAPRYVLITPARNEAEYIEETLRSVVGQTHLPERWVIVSDGSTDGTDDIVRRYAAEHSFITLIRREPDATRNFASKVFAIRAGEAALEGLDYEYIGNLDGDVSFGPEYFASVLERFEANPRVGVGSGRLYEKVDGELRNRLVHPTYSVPGPIQLFRRACYEDIGGYMPLRYGGVDAMAEASARMRGWRTQTFMDIPAVHHRVTGSAVGRGRIHAAYRDGVQEFVNGYHPLFEIVKSMRRTFVRPYVLGGLARLWGYTSAWIRRIPPGIPEDLKAYIRREQLQRLRQANSDNAPDAFIENPDTR